MTKILYPALTALLMMLLQATSSAQICSSSFSTQEFECHGPEGCDGDVYVTIPSGGQYGLNVVCGSISCCGQLFTTCNGNGGCEPTKLRPREVKERLSELSRTSEILVADCSGRYGPYEPLSLPVVARPTRSRAHTLEALNDHILR